MASTNMDSKPQIRSQCYTNPMESDHDFNKLESWVINSSNLTGFKCLTDISQTQNRSSQFKYYEQHNFQHFTNCQDPTLIDNLHYSNAKLTDLLGTDTGKGIKNETPHLPRTIGSVPLDEVFDVDFDDIASDDDVRKDPDSVFHNLELTPTNIKIIGDELKRTLMLTENTNLVEFITTETPKPATQLNYLVASLIENPTVANISEQFVNLELENGAYMGVLQSESLTSIPINAEVLAFIPAQEDQEMILLNTSQYEGSQIPSTVGEGVFHFSGSQQNSDITQAENVLPRKKGRPRKGSSQAQTKKVEAPLAQVSGERRSKLACYENMNRIVNDINTDQPEVDEKQHAGRKRKLSTSSSASSSSSSSEENKNPNNTKNNLASKKSRDKKKEQERQMQMELELLENKNKYLKEQWENLVSAIKQVQAVCMPPKFSPKQ